MKKVSSTLGLFTICLVLILSISSCEDPQENVSLKEARLEFSFSAKALEENDLEGSVNRILSADVSAIVFSIKDSDGSFIYENEKILIYKMGETFISEPISLLEGSYNLCEFYLINSANQILYISPKENSKKAYLVNDPLPINFEIIKDEVNKLSPEVLSVGESAPEDFGYTSFTYEVVETIEFLISVFIYDQTVENFVLTTSHLQITGSDKLLYDHSLSDLTNNIEINDGYDTYKLEITKEGYTTHTVVYSKVELVDFFSSSENGPLMVILQRENELILQPDADAGKDSYINSTVNFPQGTMEDIRATAWTYDGTPGVGRSLFQFDLSSLPSNAKITSAKLDLYYSPNSSHEGHSNMNGSNAAFLQRVTSPWEEDIVVWSNQPVTTSQNQVLLPESQTSDQDYVEIDVTLLVQDMISEPETNHGFMIKLQEESLYRSLIFSSSDHENTALHPRMIIKYDIE